ncbi:hypothetical protein HK102_005450 [Quaeritorhiza haematococci]|nr:hypothetical protein HK102_005450 [Quaeritorhiza haematococci]
MGKIVNNKKNKAKRKNKADPIGLGGVDVSEPILEPTPSLGNGDSIPALTKLFATEADDRAWAAAALANLVQDTPTRERLLTMNVVGLLIQALADEKLEILMEVAGGLRNLAVYGGEKICQEMYRKQIVPPLTAIIPKIGEVIGKIVNGTIGATEDEKYLERSGLALAEQVFGLMWTLSESCEGALKGFTEANVIPLLAELLNPELNLPCKLVQAAAQCLNPLTEDNVPAATYFKSNPKMLTYLIAFASGQVSQFNTWDDNRMSMRVLCAGILYNLRDAVVGDAEDADGKTATTMDMVDEEVNGEGGESAPKFQIQQIRESIFSAIAACMDYELSTAVARVAELANHEASSSSESMADEEEQHDEKSVSMKTEQLLSTVESHCGTLQLTLELLANVCSLDWKDEEVWEDMEDEGEDEAMDEDMDTIPADIALDEEPAPTTTNPLSNLITRADILTKLLKMSQDSLACSSASQNLEGPFRGLEAVQSCADLSEAVRNVSARALGAIGNVLDCLDDQWFVQNGGELVNQLWCWLQDVAGGVVAAAVDGSQNQAIALEFLESICGATLVLLKRLDTMKQMASIKVINENQVKTLVQICSIQKAAESLKVKCVASLGIIARRQGHIEANKVIGSLLMTILGDLSTGVEVVSEILNALFDIYADEAFDYDGPVFVQGNFLDRLKELYPTLRAKVKSTDKRKNRDVRERADEALMNLRAFIQYKEGEAKAKKR